MTHVFRGNPKFPLGAKIRFLSLQKKHNKIQSNSDLVFNQKQGPFSMSFRPCFDHKRIKLREIYSTQKERMFAKYSLSQRQVQVPVFPSFSTPVEKEPKERILFLSHFHFSSFTRRKNGKENLSSISFSLLYLFQKQKKWLYS